MTCLDAIIVILARPTMPCIHLVGSQTLYRAMKYFIITVNCKIVIINGTPYKSNQEIIMLSDAMSEHLFFKFSLGIPPAPPTFLLPLPLTVY